MARVPLPSADSVDDPVIAQIFDWVTNMESAVPNHFLNYGLGVEEEYVQQLAAKGAAAVADPRTRAIVEFAEKANADSSSVTDADIGGCASWG